MGLGLGLGGWRGIEGEAWGRVQGIVQGRELEEVAGRWRGAFGPLRTRPLPAAPRTLSILPPRGPWRALHHAAPQPPKESPERTQTSKTPRNLPNKGLPFLHHIAPRPPQKPEITPKPPKKPPNPPPKKGLQRALPHRRERAAGRPHGQRQDGGGGVCGAARAGAGAGGQGRGAVGGGCGFV